jgi:DNA (cytosine-5-)-methyltransferase
MTLGSLFDGIGGWLLAARHAGVTPVWASEIEPFPQSVTARHFPEVKQLGDITQIDPDAIEPIDIVCAGSPCQDLSIAGKRKGLYGERSGLFRTAAQLVRRIWEHTGGQYPRFFVWENVTGAFSSNKGADFRAVLEEIGQTEIPMSPNGKWANAGMVECDACQIAWRVLDAQYWGVPQRRRRIFLVADFAVNGRCAGEILFEPDGMRGYYTSRE